MRARKPLVLGIALVLALAGGWWFGSPWWTLWRMRTAAVAGDSEALAGYIDFPALRASTREQMHKRLPEPFSGHAGRAADILITPEMLRLGLMDPREPSTPADLDLVRKGPNEFRLRRKGWIGIGNELVFRRHGLAWRLEAINLDPAG